MIVKPTLTTLARRVADHGGILEVTMAELRDEVGAGRLGAHVLDDIAWGIRAAGLKLLGALGNDHRTNVWLYDPTSAAGHAQHAALELAELDRKTRPGIVEAVA